MHNGDREYFCPHPESVSIFCIDTYAPPAHFVSPDTPGLARPPLCASMIFITILFVSEDGNVSVLVSNDGTRSLMPSDRIHIPKRW